MTDLAADIAAIREALAASKKPGPPWGALEQAAAFWEVANPARIARILDALQEAQLEAKNRRPYSDRTRKDALRYRWLRSEDESGRVAEFWRRACLDLSLTLESLDAEVDSAMKATP